MQLCRGGGFGLELPILLPILGFSSCRSVSSMRSDRDIRDPSAHSRRHTRQLEAPGLGPRRQALLQMAGQHRVLRAPRSLVWGPHELRAARLASQWTDARKVPPWDLPARALRILGTVSSEARQDAALSDSSSRETTASWGPHLHVRNCFS